MTGMRCPYITLSIQTFSLSFLSLCDVLYVHLVIYPPLSCCFSCMSVEENWSWILFLPFRFDPFRLFLCKPKSLLRRRTNVVASGSWEIQTQISIIGLLGQHVKFFNLCKQKGSLDFSEQVECSCWLNRLYCVLILLNSFWIYEAWIGHYAHGICWNYIQAWMGASQGSSTLTPE